MKSWKNTGENERVMKNKVQLSEIFYFCFFGMMLFAKGIGLYDGQVPYKIFLILAMVAWAGKMSLTSFTWKELLTTMGILLLGVVTYLVSLDKGIFLYSLMLTGLKNVSVKRVFKVGAVVWIASFGVSVILNALHWIDGPLKIHEKLGMGMVIRWGLGQSHPNVLHISYLILVFFIVYLLEDKFGWKTAALLMFGNFAIFLYSLSSTGVITVTVYLAFCMYFKWRENFSRPEKLMLKAIFPTILIYSFAAPLLLKGEVFRWLNDLTNTRLNLAKYFLTLRKPTLFGNKVSEITTGFLTMDNSFVNGYVSYGSIFILSITVLYFLIINYSVEKENKRELAIVLACMVAGIMEPFLFNTSFKNLSLLFFGSFLFKGEEKGICILPFFNREISCNFFFKGLLHKEVAEILKKQGRKILLYCFLGGMTGAICYTALWSQPKAVVVPKKEIEVSILQKNPHMESFLLEELESMNEYSMEEIRIYQKGDGREEMILCDSRNLLLLETLRNAFLSGLLTSTVLFIIIIILNIVNDKSKGKEVEYEKKKALRNSNSDIQM